MSLPYRRPLSFMSLEHPGVRKFRWAEMLKQEDRFVRLTDGKEMPFMEVTAQEAATQYWHITRTVLPKLADSHAATMVAVVTDKPKDVVVKETLEGLRKHSPYLRALRRRMDS